MAAASDRKWRMFFESAAVFAVAIGTMILIWLYAPISLGLKIVLGPAAMILILVVYGHLRPPPLPENRKAWRRQVLKDAGWSMLIFGLLIAAALAVLFLPPVNEIAPNWMGVAALITVFIGPVALLQLLFNTPLDMIFPPKGTPPDNSDNVSDALTERLRAEMKRPPKG